jgi:TM2 domain-containing membrane protein YozV
MSKGKSKTLAAFLALALGTMGLHRFYLKGWGDWVGWLFPIPTALGWWGVERVRALGQDDQLAWVLVPMLGVALAASCLTAVVYAVTPQDKWNAAHNPHLPADAPAGAGHALTIAVLVVAMLAGTTAFMASLAFSFQRYFEYQIEEANKISQPGG